MTRTEDLEHRVCLLEDRLEITNLIASHPLSVDSGDLAFWRVRWTADSQLDKLDGSDDAGGRPVRSGREQVIEEMGSAALDGLRRKGLFHTSTAPYILLNGDRAVATNYSQLVNVEKGVVGLLQATVNRWELIRRDGQWEVELRTMRNIGAPGSLDLLKRGLSNPRTGDGTA